REPGPQLRGQREGVRGPLLVEVPVQPDPVERVGALDDRSGASDDGGRVAGPLGEELDDGPVARCGLEPREGVGVVDTLRRRTAHRTRGGLESLTLHGAAFGRRCSGVTVGTGRDPSGARTGNREGNACRGRPCSRLARATGPWFGDVPAAAAGPPDDRQEDTMTDEGTRKIAELVTDARIAMFTTVDPGGHLVSRPMGLQEVEFDGDLWFFADDRSDTAS